MEYLVVCTAAFAASGLTLFSGFGLGTLLLPVFAVFFPLPIAVALTAAVHFLNNLFKLVLFYRHIDRTVALRFGIPAFLASLAGAKLLSQLSGLEPLYRYSLGGTLRIVEPLDLVLAALLVFFALWEVLPFFQKAAFPREYLALGGALSGFFGGLSGHQGALRSAFLARMGLGKEAFLGTGIVLACLVDVVRLPVYAWTLDRGGLSSAFPLLACATVAAFLGAFLGARLVKKTTFRTIQWIVAAMILAIALGLAAGLF